MDDARQTGPGRKRGSAWLPLFFALLAVVLGVAAVVTAIQERQREAAHQPPPATPGDNQAIDVLQALQRQGIAVEFGRRGVPRGEFTVPGQELLAGSTPLYVFIFPDPAQAQQEAANADPARALPKPPAGATPTPASAPPFMTQGSNVIVIVEGGDDALRQEAQTAVEGLP
ncbi:MAG TPA: hypothetical protein VFI22_14875 [Thermomicrobiales bacterium]|nr:hypothetical protein [Thermomicrobiales bacterium]